MARLALLLILAAASSLPAHAQTQDHAPSALPSASKLEQDKPGGESWSYVKPGLSLTRFTKVLIDPTRVYTGPDAQFVNVSPADRQRFATMLDEALNQELQRAFPIVRKAGADVLRIRVTLLGGTPTKGGIATVTNVMPLGLAANAVKSLTGKKGRTTGSILLAVEISDGASGELLAAAVRRGSPDALDIPATLSTTETVKTIAHDVAERLCQRLAKAMKR
jgi:hypothetical protein